MRRIRFGVLAIASFVAVLIAAFLAPGTFLNRALSAVICTVFSFNSTFCVASLAQSSERLIAANPPAVEKRIPDISRYLQARDPSEFGDDKPATPPPTNPQVPPYPEQPDPNTPLRPEFGGSSNEMQSKMPLSPIFNISFKQISQNDVEIYMKSDTGCNLTIDVNKKGDNVYQKYIKFTPSDAKMCGSEPFTAYIQPDSKQIEVEMTNTGEKLIYEISNLDSIRVTYKSMTGETQFQTIPLQLSKQQKQNLNSLNARKKSLNKSVEDGCRAAKASCDFLSTVGNSLAIYTTAALATGIALPALPILGSILAISGLSCFVMFGGVPPIPGLGDAQQAASAASVVVSQGVSIGIGVTEGIRTAPDLFKNPLNAFGFSALDRSKPFSYDCGLTPAGQLSPWFNVNDPTLTSIRKGIGINGCAKYCKPNETQTVTQPTQPSQTAQQPQQQQAKACQIPQEFWSSHKRQIGPVNMRETTCVVQGSVMTNQGMVDGQEWCGACSASGNNAFGQPPKKVPCSQPEDPARRNPVPACPDNWSGQ